MSGIDSDLIRGHIDTIILKVLFEGDKYGYEICKEVEEKSGGTYELKQPTLYSCLKRLEGQGLISSYWEDSSIGGKRHYYKLTEQGKETYKKNQEEWLRSRQIIDNLISNNYEDASSYTLVKKDDIEELEQQVEEAQQQIEEQAQQVEENVTNQEDKEHSAEIASTLSFDQEEEIPWGVFEEKNTETIEENNKTFSTNHSVEIINQETEQSIIVDVAPNGEEIGAVVTPLEKQEETEESQWATEESLESKDAQASLFDSDEVTIDFNENVIDTPEENVEVSEGEETDIMELLGHTSKTPIEYPTRPLLEEQINEPIDAPLVIEQPEPEEEYAPFNFSMDDFVTKSQNSYFESNEVLTTKTEYAAPEMKIDGVNKNEEIGDVYSPNTENSEDDIYDETNSETPIYHNFGVDSFMEKYNHIIEEKESTFESEKEDEIYEESSIIENSEDIYNFNVQQEEPTAIVDDELKLFSEDLFENNDETVKESILELKKEDEECKCASGLEFSPTEPAVNDEIKQNNEQVLDFYKNTERYDNITPQFTDGDYKQKLTSLMAFGTSVDEEPKKVNEIIEINYNVDHKDYTELKNEFEKEGLVVRTHYKMVKESKSTRSYVESNKLNVINAWTSFGIIAFLLSLTYIIMSNYPTLYAGYDFSFKYFLYGILGIAIIPIIYTLIYFINPYKKKPARYASRISILFAILLTVQILIIIFFVNLLLGFYSFYQPNFNHLIWIIPCILALYPLTDAIFHSIFYKSHNFHV